MKSSLQTELDNFFKVLFNKELPVYEVTKSAFSQARKKFKYKAFIELNRDQINYFYNNFNFNTWKGYRLIAIDGSTCRLPNSQKIIDEYGIAATTESKTPLILARLSQAYDILNQIVIDAKLSNYHIGEAVLAEEHITHLHKSDFVLLDRNYGAFWLFSLLISKDIHFCTRLKVGSWKLAKELIASGKKEITSEIFASKASKKKCKELGINYDPFILRFICIDLDNGEKEVLVTDIIEGVQYEEFDALYHKRWFVEESYKKMKSRIEIENFTGKSPWAVKQDFYAKIFTGNLTAILVFPIHEKIKEKTKNRKEEYQLNFTQALSKMKDSIILLFVRTTYKLKHYIDQLWKLFKVNIEILRPNRKNPHNFRKSKRIYPMAYKALR